MSSAAGLVIIYPKPEEKKQTKEIPYYGDAAERQISFCKGLPPGHTHSESRVIAAIFL